MVCLGVWRGVCTPQFKNLWVAAANNNLNLPARVRFWATRVRRIDGSATATRVRWWSKKCTNFGGVKKQLWVGHKNFKKNGFLIAEIDRKGCRKEMLHNFANE